MADPIVGAVLDAIADGEDIDWISVRARHTGPLTSQVVDQLEIVSRLDRARRQPGPSPMTARSRLVRLVVWCAALQIVAGIAGMLIFRPATSVNLLRLLTILSFAGAALLLRRSRDPRAGDLGAAFVFTALSFSRIGYEPLIDAGFDSTASVRVLRNGLPFDAWIPACLWSFTRRFPSTQRFTRIDRFALFATQTTTLIGAGLFLANLWSSISNSHTGLAWQFAVNRELGQRFSATVFAFMLPALPIMLARMRSAPPEERKRVQVFVLAIIGGSLPTLIEVILEAVFPLYTGYLRAAPGPRTTMIVLTIVPLLSIPFVTAYAVLVNRLLDVRVVIHRAVGYLLARYTLLASILAPSGFLAWHVYTHRNVSVVGLLADRGGASLLGLIAASAVLIASRRLLLDRLDRWFKRTEPDRGSVLANIGGAMRLARTRSEIAATIAVASERGLNAESSLYFYDARSHDYVPCREDGPPLPVESAIGTMVAQQQGVLALGEADRRSLAHLLPGADRRWVERAGIAALAPIHSSNGDNQPIGLIALGPRRDAMTWSRQDEQFMAAMSGAAGIALENVRLKSEKGGDDPSVGFAALCSRCRRISEHVQGARLCSCGGELQFAAVPYHVNGKFRIDALLGAGGMGVAYLAYDMVLSRPVAMKTLPSVSVSALNSLGGEARTMAALSHPNLAMILSIEAWRGTPVLVCEYLAGGTLQDRLRDGRVALNEAIEITITLAGALDYMHGCGVLHRDIKPSNIGFNTTGTPKLLDFGLAGLMETSSRLTDGHQDAQVPAVRAGVAGTLAYLSPEALCGAEPEPGFDVWALNVVLYEMLAGCHPFAAGRDTADNIINGRFVPSPRLEHGLPPPVRDCVRSALHKERDVRPQSAAAARETLVALRRQLQ